MTDPFGPSPERDAVARRRLDAYAARRSSAAAKVFSDFRAASFFGSDEGEMFAGDARRRVFAAFTRSQRPLTPEDLEVEAWQRGPVGLVLLRFTLHEPDSGKRVPVRSTAVFSLEDDMWRIVHAHNSNPAPNLEAHGYDSRSLADLAASAVAERLEIGRTGLASILFTDIVDSIALAEALGDAAWSGIVTAHLDGVAEAVREAGGELVTSLGDGTLSSFASAGAAMTAARRIQRNNAVRDAEPRLRLRIGVHTGDLVGTGDDYLGGVVDKAARIAAAAGPDEIRVSDAKRAMVGGAWGFAFDDPATDALKGLEGEHLMLRLLWRHAEDGKAGPAAG
ncbi:MAG: nuclear transport factor 2 family protein [Pseudomonadota bacterium]